METVTEKENSGRQNFIGTGLKVALIAGISGTGLLSACNGNDDCGDKEVSPPEDLMQEHGLLNRVLLIHDHCRL